MTYGPLEPIGNIELPTPKIFFEGIEYNDCSLNDDFSITLTRVIPNGEWNYKLKIIFKDEDKQCQSDKK